MTNTRIALRHLRTALWLVLVALWGLMIALAADLVPNCMRLPSRSWWRYHRASILAATYGVSLGANLVGLASVTYAAL